MALSGSQTLINELDWKEVQRFSFSEQIYPGIIIDIYKKMKKCIV